MFILLTFSYVGKTGDINSTSLEEGNSMKAVLLLLLPFPSVLLLTGPIRLFKDLLYPDFDPQQWPIISSTGFLNKFLAGHCFEIFLCTFIVMNVFKCWLVCNKLPLLPLTAAIVTNAACDNDGEIPDDNNSGENLRSNKSDLNLFKQIEHSDPPTSSSRFISLQLAKLAGIYIPLVLLIVWFLGPSVYDRIYHSTGGHCVNHPEIKYYRSCVSKGYRYTGGFKCSGHGLITSTFATCLAKETLSLNNWISYVNNINPLTFRVYRSGHLLVAFTTSLYLCWLTMYTVTCLFYHTFPERVVGTACGCLIFFFVYIKCRL